MGIDVKNYANLPNIIVKDIRKFNIQIPVRLGINDVSITCPESKLAAHNWLHKNLVKNGVIVLTGHQTVKLANYSMDQLSVVFINNFATVFKKVF